MARTKATNESSTQLGLVDGGKARPAVRGGEASILITQPDIRRLQIAIRGTSALMLNRWSEKAKTAMREKQEAGSKAKSRTVRESKDFTAAYEAARYISTEGWDGIPAVSFKHAMVGACRTAAYKMTVAKQAIFVDYQGIDRADNTTQLIRIHGKPQMDVRPARNSNTSMDLRARPLYYPWHAIVVVSYDADLLSQTDVTNLMMRAGAQGGIGEGRASSRNSVGLGYGMFELDVERMNADADGDGE